VSRPAFIVALTGGIGSGKSTVAELFLRRGIPTIDADEIAHSLTAPGGAALPAIVRQFGNDILDPTGAMDRAGMRQRVFDDFSSKAALEQILHPMIRNDIETAISAAHADKSAYVLLAIPLLFETMSYRGRAHRTLAVDCPVEMQRARVRERSKLSVAQIDQIIATQVSRSIRLQMADDVISNAGSVSQLESQVGVFHGRYLSQANE